MGGLRVPPILRFFTRAYSNRFNLKEKFIKMIISKYTYNFCFVCNQYREIPHKNSIRQSRADIGKILIIILIKNIILIKSWKPFSEFRALILLNTFYSYIFYIRKFICLHVNVTVAKYYYRYFLNFWHAYCN